MLEVSFVLFTTLESSRKLGHMEEPGFSFVSSIWKVQRIYSLAWGWEWRDSPQHNMNSIRVPTENLWLIMCFYLHLALYVYICIYIKIYMYRASHLIAQLIKNLPAMQQTLVQFLVWEDPLKKGKATHSNILAWRIPWTIHGDYPWDCTWVAKSWTGLSDFHFHFPYICIY